MNYIGIDGNVHSDELKHWKYIKKIKSGSGWRYFYTPEEIRAFYNETKNDTKKNANDIKEYYKVERHRANTQWARDTIRENKRHRYSENMNKEFRKNAKEMNRDGIYATTDLITNKTRILTGKERQKRVEEANKRVDKQYKRNKRIDDFHHKVNQIKIDAVSNAKPVINTGKAIVDRSYSKKLKAFRKEQKELYRKNQAERTAYNTSVTAKRVSRNIAGTISSNERKKLLEKKRKKAILRKQQKPAARW